MLPLAQHTGSTQVPYWVLAAIGVLVLLFGAWNVAVAMGFMKKVGFRWNGGRNMTSKGPPVSRLGHAGWGVAAIIVSLALFGLVAKRSMMAWLFSAFAILALSAVIDALIDWRRKRRAASDEA